MFPHSCRFSSFHRVTNPYEASFDGVTVLGHSGQPVTDIARQRMDCMPSAKKKVAVAEGGTDEVKDDAAANAGEFLCPN